MKSKVKLLIVISLSLCLTLLLVTGCSESNITNPEINAKTGIPASEIQFVKWNAEVTANLQNLNKTIVSSKVFTQAGGQLATEAMYGCQLVVPANAFDEDERLIQANVTVENEDVAGIEFLPSQQFTKNVSIILPFSAIKIEEGNDVTELRAFWFDEESQLWVEIPAVNIDLENETATAEIDHFTRFGWGF